MGINTSAPDYTLDVQSINNFTSAKFRVKSNSAPNSAVVEANASNVIGFLESTIIPVVGTRIGTRSNSNLYFATNDVNQMILKTNGYFGINTLTPNYQLDVNGIINATGLYINGTPFSGGTSQWSNSASNIFFNTGNVGIGTSTPGAKLEVNGSISLPNSTGDKSIYTWSPADANWRIGMSTTPGFTTSLTTAHVQYATYAGGVGQGFAVGVNGGLSSFEVTGSNHNAFFRGNVGIGTATPGTKLQVNGSGTYNVDLAVSGRIQTGDGSGNGGIWLNNPGTMFVGQLNGTTLGLYNNGDWGLALDNNRNVGIGTNSPAHKLEVHGRTAIGQYTNGTAVIDAFNSYAYFGCNAPTNGLAVGPTGDVGIGNTAPGAKLDVNGPSTGNGITIRAGGGGDVVLNSGGSLFFDNNYSYASGNYIRPSEANTQTFVTSGAERMRISPSGSIGIGNSTPAAKLDVAGNIKITDGTQGGGKVLTSDANGLATWATPSYTQWTTSASNIYFNTGNIGIGNIAPSAKLDVTGNIKITDGTQGGGKVLTSDANGLATWATPSYTQWTSNASNISFNTGNVGIGTSTPGNKITIAQGAGTPRTGAFGFQLYNGNANANSKNWMIEMPNSGPGSLNISQYGDATGATPRIQISSTNNLSRIADLTIDASGKVGVGNTAPAANLDVKGTFKIADGTQGVGKVLTSDANGLARWAAPSNSTGWSLSGNSATNSATNFIGTTDNVPLNFRMNNIKSGSIQQTNTFFGNYSGNSNTVGSSNTAFGASSLTLNTTGAKNTAFGYGALNNNVSGFDNTSVGLFALSQNVSGYGNSAIGTASLQFNKGNYNTAFGHTSLYNNTSGNYNTSIGSFSGPTNFSNFENTTAIGNGATPTASNTIVIGNSSVTSIGGQVSWSTLSDGRFKANVKEDVLGLEFINELRPVTYTINTEQLDKFTGASDKINAASVKNGLVVNSLVATAKSTPVRQTGLVAQEVEAVLKNSNQTFSGLVAPQNEKDHYSIRYSDFVVPLIKAVQELSSQMQAQNKKIDSLHTVISALKNQANTGKATDRVTEGDAILNQNFPNPFTVDTEITMTVPTAAQQASLIIYNLQGTQLKSIAITGRGNVSTKIIAGEMSAGMYLYSLIVDNQLVDTKRMILTN